MPAKRRPLRIPIASCPGVPDRAGGIGALPAGTTASLSRSRTLPGGALSAA